MVAQKIFISCMVTLVLFNFVFYVSGLNADLLSAGSLIGFFLTLGAIAVVVSVIPLLNGGSVLQWFSSSLIMIGLFYSVNLSVLTYNVPIGIGLASNITNMFSSDMTALSFMPFLFFTAVGLIGIISGIIMFAGNSE